MQKCLLLDFINQYCNSPFGSLSKRDTDTSLFLLMQDLGLLPDKPKPYEVITTLHVTNAKARNLIYEASLRRKNEKQLEEDMKKYLSHPIFLSTNDNMLAFEIDDPLLADHLKYTLRKMSHITDGSFNAGIVKMSYQAYSALLYYYLSEDKRQEVLQKFSSDELKEKSGINDDDENKTKCEKAILWILKQFAKAWIKLGVEHVANKAYPHIDSLLNNTDLSDLFEKINTWLLN